VGVNVDQTVCFPHWKVDAECCVLLPFFAYSVVVQYATSGAALMYSRSLSSWIVSVSSGIKQPENVCLDMLH